LQVTTNEGNGVIHLVISGLSFVYEMRLVRMWNYYHGSQLISISCVKGTPEFISHYLMSQYLANQKCEFRFMMSRDWICKRFAYYWRIIKGCSRDRAVTVDGVTKDGFVYRYNPVIDELLIVNYGVVLDYIPNRYDGDKNEQAVLY
jgi:hypothetical protein